MNEAAATPRLRTAAAFRTRKADHLRQRDLAAEIAVTQGQKGPQAENITPA
ncbi:hypothetical protein [Streptomyces yerevanensis]|uniref:hypothetical protein n=1 Tax=Streptomyces yerevanensis TaxID=66378 RepID=UPI0012FEEE5D|nr:hypothetical protein [Streptomyces yerevanensis]